MPLPVAPANRLLQAAFGASGLPPPRAAVHSNSPSFTRSMVGSSDGLALVSQAQAQADERSGLFRRVRVVMPGAARAIGAMIRGVGQPTPDLVAVLDALWSAATSGKYRSR